MAQLAAGEKQKVEILKQLYLERRFMILDEPTSVLTPSEADEALGMLKDLTRQGKVTVLMITHKFREVMAFADAVSVLRRGRHAGEGLVRDLDVARMAEMMVGEREIPQARVAKSGADAAQASPRLQVRALHVEDDAGLSIERLKRVGPKLKEYVDNNKLAALAGNLPGAGQSRGLRRLVDLGAASGDGIRLGQCRGCPDHRMPLCPRPGDADVDHGRRRARRSIRRADQECRGAGAF